MARAKPDHAKCPLKSLTVFTGRRSAKLVNEDDIRLRAVDAVEQNGIVFLDEIDKICKRSELGGVAVKYPVKVCNVIVTLG